MEKVKAKLVLQFEDGAMEITAVNIPVEIIEREDGSRHGQIDWYDIGDVLDDTARSISAGMLP